MEAQPSHSSSTPIVSRVLALALRRLGDDWLQHHRNPIQLIESFVDGTIFLGPCSLQAPALRSLYQSICSLSDRRSCHGLYHLTASVMIIVADCTLLGRLCLSQNQMSSKELLKVIQGHRSAIENRVQYRRDVSFEENQCG